MDGGKLIYQLIPKVMKDIGVVGKGRKNKAQDYAFRGIDDMYNAVQPVLITHGVFVVPTVTQQHREERQTRSGANMIYTVLTVKHAFYAPDGSSVEAVTVGEAMDSGDKSANKAMSAAMKYALIEVFSIPTEGDNDTENHSHEVVAHPLADAAVFQEMLTDAYQSRGFSPEEMQKANAAARKGYKVSSLADLPPDHRQAMLDGVMNGKADKYKAAATAGAN